MAGRPKTTPNQLAPEFALYHPWPPIDGHSLGEWVKTMLLFFEGVAILAPPAEGERLVTREEETLAPLADQGLFRVLNPADLIQKREAKAILKFLLSMASSLKKQEGAEQSLWSGLLAEHRAKSAPYELHIAPQEGPVADEVLRGGMIYSTRSLLRSVDDSVKETATMLWQVLQWHGLATSPDTYGNFRMHPIFWAVYEAFLAHSLYDAGLRAGLSLRPATDHEALIDTRNALLDVPGRPSSGHVIEFDLQQVTLDLSRCELSEILQFRDEYGAEYRRYIRDLREFAVAASRAEGEERRRLMQDRRDALADAADELRRMSRDWWRRAASSICVGISGAAWSASSGTWPPAIIAALGGAVGMGAKPKLDNAFSYLFRIEQSFAGR